MFVHKIRCYEAGIRATKWRRRRRAIDIGISGNEEIESVGSDQICTIEKRSGHATEKDLPWQLARRLR